MTSETDGRCEERVLTLFLTDTSRSMGRETKDHQGRERPLIDQLNKALRTFTNEVGDSEVVDKVDIGLVSFGGGVTVEEDFQPIKSSWVKDGPPKLSAGGHSPLCEAIITGLNKLKNHIVETDRTQTQALIWLLTDGKLTETEGEKWKKTKREIEHMTEDNQITFYAVGLGEEPDLETLWDILAGVDDENKFIFPLEEGQTPEPLFPNLKRITQGSENIGRPNYDGDPNDIISGDTTENDDGSCSVDNSYGDNTDDGSEKNLSESSDISAGEFTEGDDILVGTSLVTIGPEIGTGAEGTVYHIQGKSDSVLKIFNKKRRDEKENKVRAMIENPPIDDTYEKNAVRSIIWPREIAEDSSEGAFVGYKMPYRDLEQAKNALEYAMTDLNWDKSATRKRYEVAYNLALLVKNIHEQGHAIYNFNHDKILIDNGLISLIDCDAFHITDGNKNYHGYTYYPRYSPPGDLPETLEEGQKADRFGLGVHIFQFLMEGLHPLSAGGSGAATGTPEDVIRENPFPYDANNPNIRPPKAAPNYDHLPEDIKQLFSDCFHNKRKLSRSPTPGEWIETFTNKLSESGPEY